MHYLQIILILVVNCTDYSQSSIQCQCGRKSSLLVVFHHLWLWMSKNKCTCYNWALAPACTCKFNIWEGVLNEMVKQLQTWQLLKQKSQIADWKWGDGGQPFRTAWPRFSSFFGQLPIFHGKKVLCSLLSMAKNTKISWEVVLWFSPPHTHSLEKALKETFGDKSYQ